MELKLTNDFIFKYVFWQEDNAPHLALVNAVLEDSDFKLVVSLEIQNPTIQKDADWLCGSILDIKAKDENGAECDIEIHIISEPNYKNRSLFYWSKMYANQCMQINLQKNENFGELKPVICINLVDYVLFKSTFKSAQTLGILIILGEFAGFSWVTTM